MEDRSIAFARWMAEPPGRLLRIAAGGAIAIAALSAGGRARWLALAGLLPLAAGGLNLCLLSPFLGVPIRGREVLPPPRRTALAGI